MTRVLDRQLQAYGSADTGSAGPTPDRRTIESAIDVGVGLFEAAKNEVRRWQRDMADWDAPDTVEHARAYDRTYRTLHASLSRLMSDAGALQDSQTPPENLDRLRAAVQELDGIVCFDLERVIRADRAFRTGRPAHTTAEVRDGLRRRVGG